jgi:hypothetical protein
MLEAPCREVGIGSNLFSRRRSLSRPGQTARSSGTATCVRPSLKPRLWRHSSQASFLAVWRTSKLPSFCRRSLVRGMMLFPTRIRTRNMVKPWREMALCASAAHGNKKTKFFKKGVAMASAVLNQVFESLLTVFELTTATLRIVS